MLTDSIFCLVFVLVYFLFSCISMTVSLDQVAVVINELKVIFENDFFINLVDKAPLSTINSIQEQSIHDQDRSLNLQLYSAINANAALSRNLL